MNIKIIAEIGINHNGDVETAKDLIDAADVAGCDYVKFQKRTPEICVPPKQRNIVKQTPWGEMTYMDYKKRMEFEALEYDQIEEYANNWFVSVWDTESVKFIENGYDPDYYKIPSALLTDTELLRSVADTGRPVILSTGMSTTGEIETALRTLSPAHRVMLMHSVSCYPLNDSDANLRAIETLQAFGYPVGYSDHTRGLHMACAAVAMGVQMIEKHITLDRTMWGTDQSASLEPEALRKFVRNIRAVEAGMGNGDKESVQECELEAKRRLRG